MSMIKCEYCNINFEKQQKYINAALKKGRKNFCTISCSTSHKNSISNRSANKFLPQNQKGYRQKNYNKFNWYISRCRSRKKNNGITTEMLKDLWNKQRGLCAISNLPINLHGECIDNLYLASLDRIDSSLPYQEGNIQFVALPLNLAKQSFSNEKFGIFLKEVSSHMASEVKTFS